MAYNGMFIDDIYAETRTNLGNPSTSLYTNEILRSLINRVMNADILSAVDIPVSFYYSTTTLGAGEYEQNIFNDQNILKIVSVYDITNGSPVRNISLDDYTRRQGEVRSGNALQTGNGVEYYFRVKDPTSGSGTVIRVFPEPLASTVLGILCLNKVQILVDDDTSATYSPFPNEFDPIIIDFLTARLAKKMRLWDEAKNYLGFAVQDLQRVANNYVRVSDVRYPLDGFKDR